MSGIIESVTIAAGKSAVNDYKNRLIDRLLDELDVVKSIDYQSGIEKAIRIIRSDEVDL